MTELPLYLLLIPYGILVAVFFILALINIYHMIVYGFLSFSSTFMTFIFLVGTIIIFYATYALAADIDWMQVYKINLFLTF